MNLIGLFPRSLAANWDRPFQAAHPPILSPNYSTIERHSLLPTPAPHFKGYRTTCCHSYDGWVGGWVGGCLITRPVGSEYHQPWP
jgi:hypothetical protein